MGRPSRRAAAALLAALAAGGAAAQHLQLPALNFGYADLEPYIDEATMEVHHLGHLQAYTDKANAALAELRANATTNPLAKLGLDALLSRLDDVPEPQRSALRNHGGGYVNHEHFFASLGVPEEKGGPGGRFLPGTPLGQAIARQFVSFAIFQELFRQAALRVFGSGWVWLELDKRGGDNAVPVLAITTTPNQDSLPMDSPLRVPLLGLDVWEHAYYLKHKNKRGDYIDDFWKVVDWTVVEGRFATAIGETPQRLEWAKRAAGAIPDDSAVADEL